MPTLLASLVFAFAILAAPSARASDDHALSVAGFAGLQTAHSDTHFALGVDAELHPIPFFGVVAFAERVPDPKETSAGLGLAVHPIPLFGLRLHVIPGISKTEGQDADFLIRLGGQYEFGFGPVFGGPVFNVDHSKYVGTAFVYGLMVGIGI